MTDAADKSMIHMTPELITGFLKSMEEKGMSRGSLEAYQRILQGLYDYLSEEKAITESTGESWRRWLLEQQKLSQRTVNTHLSVFNSFLQYLGRRQWQMGDFFRSIETVQPELTRAEYLRMLSAAKRTEREKSYLIIKTLGGAGVRGQELSQVTAEAVKSGAVSLSSHNGLRQRVLYIPQVLRKELTDYMNRENIKTGPIFITEEGKPISRTVIHHYVSSISQDAQVEPEKANPRCLWKMYLSTREELEANIQVLLHQIYEQMLEQEQISIGWDTA